jgi:hypothetical protein
MKTKDFADFAGTSSGRRAETLLFAHKVTAAQIFATVLDEVTQAIPHLLDGCKYSTQMLCDPAIWPTWSKAKRCVAGMCLAYLVRNRVLQLFRHLTPSGKGKTQYRTTPTPRFPALKTTKITPIKPAVKVLQLMRDRRTPCQ